MHSVTNRLLSHGDARHGAGFRFIESRRRRWPGDQGAMWYPCSQPPERLLSARSPCRSEGLPVSRRRAAATRSRTAGAAASSAITRPTKCCRCRLIGAAINHPGDTASDTEPVGRSGGFRRAADRIKRADRFHGRRIAFRDRIDPRTHRLLRVLARRLYRASADRRQSRLGHAHRLCQQSSGSACEQILRKEYPAQPLAHDPRIKAAVIADPLAPYSSQPTAWRRSRCRCSSGRRSAVATACCPTT